MNHTPQDDGRTGKHCLFSNDERGRLMLFKILKDEFTVCKVEDYSGVDLQKPCFFAARTVDENSLVCPSIMVPQNAVVKEEGWRGFYIAGKLDFSLIGILSKISAVLAENKIGIFVVSPFDTDYIFVKKENFIRAAAALKEEGYLFEE